MSRINHKQYQFSMSFVMGSEKKTARRAAEYAKEESQQGISQISF